MEINVCYPTLCKYDLLAQSIESVMAGSVKPTQINVIDNGGKFIENFGESDEINLFVPKSNWGCARSWNHFMHSLDDHIIISNDDVIFHEKTIELLVEAAEENPTQLMFSPDCYWEHKFSLLLLRKEALSIVGEFDGNFFPAYFEDQDYMYRMKLAGYEPFIVKGCTYTHVEGGSKTSRNTVSSARFAQLGEYYIKKWGGLPRNETFTKPFNLIGD